MAFAVAPVVSNVHPPAHATGVDVSGAVNIHHALGFSLLATSGALLLSLSREWLSRQWTRFTVWLELTLDGLLDFNSLNVGDGLGSVSVSTSSALSESVRGRCLMKLYDLRFGAGSAGELRREMDALHRHPDGSLNWQASNAAIIASMERRLAEVPSPGTPDYEACAQDALDDAAKTACTSCSTLGHWSPDCPASRIRAHPSAAEDGLLPCRGCSWCGVDPGDLPDALWTECDGSGRVCTSRRKPSSHRVR